MVLTKDQWMELGLETLNFCYHFKNYDDEKRQCIFRKFFLVTPTTCAELWDAFNDHPRIEVESGSEKHLLMTLRFLYRYQQEHEIGKDFKIKDKRTVSKWVNIFLRHLELLLADKMVPWEQMDAGFYIFMTIDGTHCPIDEPNPIDPKWSSHKLGGAPAVNYEFGLQIHQEKLLWINGPIPAGLTNDLGVFRMKGGLKEKLLEYGNGKLVLGDAIYCVEDEYELVTGRNDFDPPELAEFKDRSLSRHEFFNLYVKKFNVFDSNFRHGEHKEEKVLAYHGLCMKAALAIISFQFDNGSWSLFEPYPWMATGRM